MNFVVIFLTAKYLLDEGRGEAAVFMANIAFIILVNGFIGSSVIVYLTPKNNIFNLLIPSYIWAAISSILTPLLFSLFMPPVLVWLSTKFGFEIETEIWGFELIRSPHYILLMACSFLGSIFEYNYMVLLGKQKITQANLLNVSRNIVLVFFLFYVFYFLEVHDVYAYFLGIFIAYTIGLLLSFISIFSLKEKFDFQNFYNTLKSLITLGFVDQLSNILQFINKRLPLYYLMYVMNDKGDTGVLSIAIALTEAFLFLPQSVSVVQYSKISNSNDSSFNISISEKMYRFNFTILAVGLGILSIIPDQLFVWIFGNSFHRVGDLIPLLAIGLVFFGSTSVFNHYFSGTGKFEENVYSNLLGLAATIGFGCFWLIPTYGIWGAALTPSISYVILGLYLIISFKYKANSNFKALVPTRTDFIDFVDLLSSKIKNRIG